MQMKEIEQPQASPQHLRATTLLGEGDVRGLSHCGTELHGGPTLYVCFPFSEKDCKKLEWQ